MSRTIKNHLRKIFDKLRVTNRVELAILAKELQSIAQGEPAVGQTKQAGSEKK